MHYLYSEHSRKLSEARLISAQQTHAAREQDEEIGVSYDGLVVLGAYAVAASTGLDQMRLAAIELQGTLSSLVKSLEQDIAFLNGEDDEDEDDTEDE